GVVGQAQRHERRAEVGVADADVAGSAGLGGDLVGRVLGSPDQDVLRGHDHADGVLEGLDVELAVIGQVRQQVDAGQVAGAVGQPQVLAARVAGVDPTGVRRRVPAVDRRVELHAGICALPGRL